MKHSLAERFGDCGCAVGDLELLVDVLEVGLDGRGAQEQKTGDLRARTALGGEGKDLPFTAAETRTFVMAVGADLRCEPVMDVGGEVAAASRHRADGVTDRLALGVLGDV